jgi:rubredoxin
MASNNSAIPAPELSFVRSMADTEGKWVLHGDYSIWSGAQKPGEPPYLLNEWRDNGVLPIPPATSHPIMHRIPAGTPFEVARLFGFWLVVDVDTVWIDAAGVGGQHYALIVGGTQGKPGEAACLWVCPKCAALFARETFAVPRQRFERFLDFAEARVRAFNADPQRRACPSCGAVHPPSYGFNAKLDSDEERQARQAP